MEVHKTINTMKRKLLMMVSLLGVCVGLNSCYYDNEEELYPAVITCDTITVTYSKTIVPILTSYCYSCHSGSAPTGGLNLDSYASASAQATSGKLYGVVSHTSGSPMPKNGTKLEDCKISQIQKWAKAGAPNN